MKKYPLFLLLLVLSNTLFSQVPSARITFTSLSQMTTYAGSYTEAFYDDKDRGGFFVLKTAPSVIDSGMTFPSGKAGKAWVRDLGENRAVYLSWYGAVGDGFANDYTRIKAFTDWITANAVAYNIQDIYFGRNKTYWSDKGYNGIETNDFNLVKLRGVTIHGGNSTIKTKGTFTKTNDLSGQVRLTFDSCDNVTIKDLTIDQENQYTVKNGTTESTRHCFMLKGCRQMILENCTALNAQVDGFHISESSNGDPRRESRNIMLINCRSFFAGRQGMSVIQCVGLTAINCEFKYTGQHRNASYAPTSGVDIEPNRTPNMSPGTGEATGRILFKNCVFGANWNSQFVCGGTPTMYGNVTIENCIFRDIDSSHNDTIYYAKGSYDYRIDIGGRNVKFINNRCNLSYGFFSVGFGRSVSDMASTTALIEGNSFSFADTTKQWIRVSDGCEEVKFINNVIKGTAACTPFPSGTACIIIDNGTKPHASFIWDNNYVFIPKEKFRIGLANDYLNFVDLNRCMVSNSIFETDLTATYLGGTTCHFNIALASCFVDNVRLKGTNPGFSETVRATNSTSNFNNINFNSNWVWSTNRNLMSDSLLFSSGILNRANVIKYGSTFPAVGHYIKGDIVFNNAVSAGGPVGWICVTNSSGGNGGTWAAISSAAAVLYRAHPLSIILAIILAIIILLIVYKYLTLTYKKTP